MINDGLIESGYKEKVDIREVANSVGMDERAVGRRESGVGADECARFALREYPRHFDGGPPY